MTIGSKVRKFKDLAVPFAVIATHLPTWWFRDPEVFVRDLYCYCYNTFFYFFSYSKQQDNRVGYSKQQNNRVLVAPSRTKTIGSKVRKFTNWAVPIVLLTTYFPPLFGDPTAFVGDLSPSEKGRSPAEIWAETPPTSRGLGPQLAGWAFCLVTCKLTFLISNPNDERTHILLARSSAINMLIVWPVIWYLAMLPKKDYAPMDFDTYMYDMSTTEIVMGVVFVITGWFVPPAEKPETKRH